MEGKIEVVATVPVLQESDKDKMNPLQLEGVLLSKNDFNTELKSFFLILQQYIPQSHHGHGPAAAQTLQGILSAPEYFV